MSHTQTTTERPLDGVRVLDCTQVLAGPFATQLLVDLGAEVIKIERSGYGDLTRSVGFELGDSGLTDYFSAMNRGKKSVELDLSSDGGAEAFERLAEKADVVVENYRPGTMEKWGLGYEDIREINENIVYCSISGFLEGPYRNLPAFDMVVQALGGSMSVTGEKDGPPMRPGIPIGDVCAGMYAVIGIVSSLYSSDTGQYIEVPMFEGLATFLTERASRTFATGEPYPRLGTTHPSLAPYRAFETADGWFAIAIASDGLWQQFCKAIDRPDLAADERYETNADRLENRESLTAELEPMFAERSNDEWFELFRKHELPCAPVQDTKELFEDEHLRKSGILEDLEIGGVDFPYPLCPIQFSEQSIRSGHMPSKLGADTEEVLSDVFSESELDNYLEED